MIKKYSLKFFWFFGNPIKRLYWFLFRPKTRGAKCLVQNDGKTLFVRLSYGHKGWTVPGGKVNKNESFEDAIRREVKEEVGIILNEIKLIGEYVNTKEYKIDTVQCFQTEVESLDFKIDGTEIAEARWVSIDDIPKPHSPRLPLILQYIK